MRLGSYYRSIVAPYLGVAPTGSLVLDVGAADGALLERFPQVRGVALDPSPNRSGNATFIKGDGIYAPFASGTFDTVFAFDVLEHVRQDDLLMRELLRLTRPGGTLWVSVPSRELSVFPAFVTGFLHRRWGHVRPGYRWEEVMGLLPLLVEVTVYEWNEPTYRLAYIALKLLSLVAPGLARRALRTVARLDSDARPGRQGHLFFRIRVSAAGME